MVKTEIVKVFLGNVIAVAGGNCHLNKVYVLVSFETNLDKLAW